MCFLEKIAATATPEDAFRLRALLQAAHPETEGLDHFLYQAAMIVAAEGENEMADRLISLLAVLEHHEPVYNPNQPPPL